MHPVCGILLDWPWPNQHALDRSERARHAERRYAASETSVKDGAFYGWPLSSSARISTRTMAPNPNSSNAHSYRTLRFRLANTTQYRVLYWPQFPALSKRFVCRLARIVEQVHDQQGEGDLRSIPGGKPRRSKASPGLLSIRLRGDQQVGPPVGVTVAPDGSVLFSDDGGNRIWRVRYTG